MGFLSWLFSKGENPSGKGGEVSGRSITELIKELADRNADTALRARDQLRLAGENAVSATARCLLGSGPTQQRYLAAQVLGDIGNSEAVDALMAVLNDSDPVVCAWSARSLVPAGDKRALEAMDSCIRRLPAGTGRSIVEGAAQHLENRLSKRTAMQEALREDNAERLWDVKEAKAEHADLLEAKVIRRDELAETNIYEVIPLKEGVEIHEGDSIKLRGLQICPATRISTAVDTDISWGKSSTLSCEVCGELRLTGMTTSQGGRGTKSFLLLHKKRLPADSGFLPHLEILQISPQEPSARPASAGGPVERLRDVGVPTDSSVIEAAPATPMPVKMSELPKAIAPFDAEQARAYQEQAAEFLGIPVEETEELKGGIAIEWILIPPGEFDMGSPEDDEKRGDHERQHRVTLTKPFYCGRFPVTQGQWEAVMGENPSDFQDAGEDAPVDNTSWDDCQVFVKKLCEKESVLAETYRLLTEAEWEYACRAGSVSHFCFGDDESALDAYGWYDDNSNGETHPVGQKQPNAFGLYDMHGNMYEWCQDWYGEYPSGSVTDPLGPHSGEYPVNRGGCYLLSPWFCRSAFRNSGLNLRVGLRLARTIPSLL